MQENITETMAKFVSRLSFDDLPDEVVHETKRIILDIVGCALGSLDLDKGRMAVDFARQMGGTKEATILGTGEKSAAPIAAFANGELMHTMDYCPVLAPAHVTPYVTAAPLALAEAKKSSGKDLITAVALAHEVAARIGVSMGPLRAKSGGFPARNLGMSCVEFGAAAGAAKILGLGSEQMADALGLAGYFAPVPSLSKFLYTPYNGMAKYGPAGWIAQGGVTAALLAGMGSQGDRQVLDGEYGFWAMNGSEKCDWAKITGKLGEEWITLQVAYKYWPCCGMFQSPLTSFTKLINDHSLKPDEIQQVLVKTEEFGGLPRYQTTDIHSQIDAQASLPYNIAVAAHGIKVGPTWQSKSTIENPSIQEFMKKKFKYEPYPRCEEARYQELVVEGRPYIIRRPSQVQVTARGKVFTETTEYAKWISAGNPDYRATDEGLIEKFRTNASGTLKADKLASAIDTIMNLERVRDSAELIEMLAC